MNSIRLSEIDWSPEAAGTWPWPIKLAVCLLLFGAIIGVGYAFILLPLEEKISRAKREEKSLKESFRKKWEKAAHLPLYIKRLEMVSKLYEELVYQLPTREEMPSFLRDVSETATTSGLELLLFKPQEEIHHDFYAEIPITVRAKGTFNEIGTFLGTLAALPRIITVEDISVHRPEDKERNPEGVLELQALLKTYRYLTEEERLARKEKKGRKRKR